MNLTKIIRNHFAVFFLVALAASGVAYLAWAIGANVNCIAGTCFSTNGQTDSSSSYDTSTVFTGENDTASIECTGNVTPSIYELGGGNDVAYLVNPQTATLKTVIIRGQSGDDVILSQCTNDGNSLEGGDGNDFIAGDADDTLVGGAGNDLLAGGQGDDFLGDTDGNGSCSSGESDPGNDVLVGGPGTDTYCTADNDGDDIVIIHAGDVPAGNNETYSCEGDDIILLFGFNLDLVVTVKPTDNEARYYNLTADPTPGVGNDAVIGDPVNNPTGSSSGAQYTFTADKTGATGTCTIIVAE
jgi:Ca2+-binding RTX toxin-like protein